MPVQYLGELKSAGARALEGMQMLGQGMSQLGQQVLLKKQMDEQAVDKFMEGYKMMTPEDVESLKQSGQWAKIAEKVKNSPSWGSYVTSDENGNVDIRQPAVPPATITTQAAPEQDENGQWYDTQKVVAIDPRTNNVINTQTIKVGKSKTGYQTETKRYQDPATGKYYTQTLYKEVDPTGQLTGKTMLGDPSEDVQSNVAVEGLGLQKAGLEENKRQFNVTSDLENKRFEAGKTQWLQDFNEKVREFDDTANQNATQFLLNYDLQDRDLDFRMQNAADQLGLSKQELTWKMDRAKVDDQHWDKSFNLQEKQVLGSLGLDRERVNQGWEQIKQGWAELGLKRDALNAKGANDKGSGLKDITVQLASANKYLADNVTSYTSKDTASPKAIGTLYQNFKNQIRASQQGQSLSEEALDSIAYPQFRKMFSAQTGSKGKDGQQVMAIVDKLVPDSVKQNAAISALAAGDTTTATQYDWQTADEYIRTHKSSPIAKALTEQYGSTFNQLHQMPEMSSLQKYLTGKSNMIENFVTEKGVKTAANLLGPLGPTVSQLLPDNPAVSLKKALEKKDPMVKEAAAFLYSQQTGQELTYAQEYWLRTHPKSVEAATSIIKSLKKGKK